MRDVLILCDSNLSALLQLLINYFLGVLFGLLCWVAIWSHFTTWIDCRELFLLLTWSLLWLIDYFLSFFLQRDSCFSLALLNFWFETLRFSRGVFIFWRIRHIWKPLNKFSILKMSPTLWVYKHLAHILFRSGIIVLLIIEIV